MRALGIVLLACGFTLTGFAVARAYGSWFRMQGPPGCNTVTSLAVSGGTMYAACDDGRIYYRPTP